MGTGIRLVHDTLSNAFVAVEHPTMKYKRGWKRVSYDCPRCLKSHDRKTIHLDLDADRTVVVSKEAFKLINEAGRPGFSIVGDEPNPPEQVIDFNVASPQPKLRTKYEGKHPHFYIAKKRLKTLFRAEEGMANFVTTAQRNAMLGSGTFNDLLDTATFSAMFIDNADDTIVAGDTSLTDVVSAARIPAAASTPALAGKSVTTGTLDATDTVFTALSGDPFEQMILFNNTGTDSTALIVASWDLTGTPNGGNITVVWNASGILAV